MAQKETHKYQSTAIIMPEYGRHIQDMVLHCIELKDADERLRCAKTIVKAMSLVAPEKIELKEREAYEKSDENFSDSANVYWDHLAIISQFELKDICPEGTISQEEYEKSHQKIKLPYMSHNIRYRYYGHLIENAIEKACAMPQGSEKRRYLEFAIARQMKRNYMTWNSDIVGDLKIFTDLYELSKERIMLTPENCPKLNINPNSIERQTIYDKKGKGRNNKRQTNKRR